MMNPSFYLFIYVYNIRSCWINVFLLEISVIFVVLLLLIYIYILFLSLCLF